MKCFGKVGVLDESFAVSSLPCEESNPFEDADEADNSEIDNLISQLGPVEASRSVSKYISGDDNYLFALRLTMNSGKKSFFTFWPNTFWIHLHRIRRWAWNWATTSWVEKSGEAITNPEKVQEFLDSKGYIPEATAIGSVIDAVATLQFKVSHQSTLDQFISWS